MTLTTGAVLTDTSIEEVDGASWIDQQVKDHDFTIKRGSGASKHNANLTITAKQTMRLLFARTGPAPRRGVTLGPEVLLVPAGTEVVIYRKYTGAPATAAIATFSAPGPAGRITQTTVYRGSKWRVVRLDRR